MKKMKLFFTLGFFTLVILHTNAGIWRINNLSNYDQGLFGSNVGGTSLKPVFKQLSDAMSYNPVSQISIDTLYVEGTNVAYNSFIVNKKVIIIGTGYFLSENINVSTTPYGSNVGSVIFIAGSDSSQIIGMHVTNVNGISINNSVSYILIKRCQIDYSVGVGYLNTYISVLQNYFSNTGNNTSSVIASNVNGFPTHFIFNNNICKKAFVISNSTTVYNAEQVNNNVFDCPSVSGGPSLKFNSGECRNNIIKTTGITVQVNGANTNFTNNTSAIGSEQLGNDATNHVINISTLFVASGTTDGAYQLISSPQTVGFDGYQIGAYGGPAITNQYTLSGLAAIPVIYSIQTSGVSDNTNLPVKIRARIIN